MKVPVPVPVTVNRCRLLAPAPAPAIWGMGLSMFLDFSDCRVGGPLVKVFLRSLSTNFAFYFSPLNTEFVLCFWTF